MLFILLSDDTDAAIRKAALRKSKKLSQREVQLEAPAEASGFRFDPSY